MKEVTWEETLPVQCHKVTVLKYQILFAHLKTINLARRNKSLCYSFPFSANFNGVFVHKIKAKKRTISHYKTKNKTSNKLHSILWNFWVVRFLNPVIWSQLFCLFVFKCCCFCRAICIKGMKKWAFCMFLGSIGS